MVVGNLIMVPERAIYLKQVLLGGVGETIKKEVKARQVAEYFPPRAAG